MIERLSPDLSQLPDPRAPDSQQLGWAWLAGTYSSGWPQLKQATFSSLQLAAYGTSETLHTCERIAAKNLHPAEAAWLADTNYSIAMLGPCLGGILLAAFAVESFVRLGYVVALEIRSSRSRSERSKGFSSLMETQLSQFDELTTKKRIQKLRVEARIAYDREKEKALEKLVHYRNSIAHNVPILTTVEGEMKATRGQYRRRGPSAEPFEEITSSQRPVRLKHVIRAIRIHDEFVTHVLKTGRLQGWSNELKELGGPWTTIAETFPGTKLWEQARRLAKAWEKGPEVKLRASLEQRYEYGQKLVRRGSLKVL